MYVGRVTRQLDALLAQRYAVHSGMLCCPMTEMAARVRLDTRGVAA